MPFTKQHSAYAWVVTCILFLINLTFHNLPLHSSYKIHQPITDYFLRLPYSELLETHLFRSRANRRLVIVMLYGSCNSRELHWARYLQHCGFILDGTSRKVKTPKKEDKNQQPEREVQPNSCMCCVQRPCSTMLTQVNLLQQNWKNWRAAGAERSLLLDCFLYSVLLRCGFEILLVVAGWCLCQGCNRTKQHDQLTKATRSQRTEDRRTRRPGTRQPGDQGTRRPRDQGTKRTRRPGDQENQETKSPRDQGTKRT